MSLTQDVDFRELLDAFAEAWFQQYHAPVVGRVESYDKATQTADVAPMLLLRVEGQDVTSSPVLRSIPVAFPGGAFTSYTWPLVNGDPVELIPHDADFGAYFSSGSVKQLPQSKRRFSLSDCVCIPVAPRSQASPLPATAVADDGGVLAGLHYLGGSDATDFVAMAAKVLSELEKIKTALSGHVHDGGTYTNGGGAVTGTSGLSPTFSPASVAATLAKVK
jgi:hypothetical protein